MFEEIKKIADKFFVAGYEKELTSFIKEEAEKCCDECFIDNIGNLIAHKKGKGRKTLINIPISSDGVFITHITENGYGKFSKIGKIKETELIGSKVKNISGQVIGIINTDAKKDSDIKTEDLYIDFGVGSKEEAGETASVGDVLLPFKDTVALSKTIYGSNLSKAADIYVGLSLLRELKTELDLYIAFTIMDNLGFKGAKTAANLINPEMCYVIGGSDTLNKNTKINLNKGPVIRIKDSFIIVNKELREGLIKRLSKEEIPYQLEIVTEDGITNNRIMYSGNGVLTLNINCPVKHMGTLYEGINLNDIKNIIKSLKVVLV